MDSKGVLGARITLVLILVLWIPATAQVAKQGTYTSHFGWYSIGKTFEFEKDHTLFQGEFNGTNFNDAGEGFLHQTSVVCPGVIDTNKGIGTASGTCLITDKDGDKVFLAWTCKNPGSGCQGTFQWTGGTGKYTGITGNNTFTGYPMPSSASGYSVWKGDWKLP